MANDVQLNTEKARWPTGVTTLIGLLAGALAGLIGGFVPVGTVAGLAVGVGIDSLMNHWLNGKSGVRP
ncbi:MAG: hypothetical protein GX573_02165 [Chloroflexi bacterium]|jgi:hypothetical protein|nr:hypothetical protein [Chloroflexota bacterium]